MKRGKRRKGWEREEEERKGGEGGSCVIDISDGHWASSLPSGSVMILDDHLCSSWSNFVHDVASKRYVFLLKNTFHPSRTLLLEGPNYVKNYFSSFHKHHLFPEKNDRVLIT